MIKGRKREIIKFGSTKNKNLPFVSIKILKTEFEKEIRSVKWFAKLFAGDLYSFEQELHDFLLRFYDKICELIISQLSVSSKFEKLQRKIAKLKGWKKLILWPTGLQLRTSRKIK